MREIIPGFAGGAIIFPHGAPSPLTQILTPEIPAFSQVVILGNPGFFGVHANAVQSHFGFQANLLLRQRVNGLVPKRTVSGTQREKRISVWQSFSAWPAWRIPQRSPSSWTVP